MNVSYLVKTDLVTIVGDFLRVKSFLFCALEHDNSVSKERLKVSNYLLIILFYTIMFMYKYLQDVLTTLCFSSQKPIMFSSVLLCSPCTVECSALYTG